MSLRSTGRNYATAIIVMCYEKEKPDGQRFLINTPVEGATSPPLTVVLNWLSGVRR